MRRLIWCLALAPIAASAAYGDERSVKQLVEDAASARDHGDLPAALALLEQAYAAQPSPAILHNVGMMLEAIGRYRDAAAAFRHVATSKDADPTLRDFDAKRERALAPKIGRAFVSFAPDSRLSVRVDGRPFGGQEEDLEPAVLHPIEIHAENSPVAILRQLVFPAGVRTALAIGELAGDARIVATNSEHPLLELEIDGYALRSAPVIEAVVLAPGKHQVRVEYARGRDPVATVVVLAPGQVLELGAPSVQPAVVSPIVGSAPPPPSHGPGPWPWAVAGAGVAATVVGVAMVIAAGADRDALFAVCDERTMRCSVSSEEAHAIQDARNTKLTVGPAMLIGGAAAVLGGLGWWVFADD